MRLNALISLFLALPIAACTSRSESVDVTISATKYTTGNTSSELATVVVDEVERQKPAKVHIHTCTSTPPEKVQQFNSELAARSKATVTMSFTAQGC